MTETARTHMTPEEFRRYGRAVVDWVADYMERVESFPVLSQAAPGDVRSMLPPQAPEHGEAFDSVLADLEAIVLPGVTHWQSPNFFAYFPANASGPAILGDLVSSGLGVQGMLWATGPAATELETHVMDWLVDAMGLPKAFRTDTTGGGVIQDSASSSSLVAVLAARERATAGATNAHGLAGTRLTAYTSSQAHSSIEKGVRIAGIGAEHLRVVEVDPTTLAMRPDALRAAIEADVAAGMTPFFVAATVGTTSTHAIDPLAEIGAICQEHGSWLHVDAAHAGAAAICPEYRWIHDGLDLADSYVFDPHKWMFTNFDCSAFFVADRGALIRALSILPEYLRNIATESGAVIDYRDWMVPLGRRFRALKLWFVLRWYGVEGLRAALRANIEWAQELAQWVREDPDWELVVEPPLSLVCLRHVGGDEVTQRVVEDVNASGAAYLTHTKVGGRYVARVSVGATSTTRAHVVRLWDLLRTTAEQPPRR